MYNTLKKADIIYDITVAIATPNTFILSKATKTKSNIMFKTVVSIKKYKGVLLSPKALNILEAPLYISCPNDKPTHICKYNTELSIMSVGVCNNIIRGLDKNMPSIKRINELNNVKYIELRKVTLSILSFLAPKNCPITIEKALVKPIAKDKKKNIVEVVAPIEANALEPTNLPIMMVSATP